MSSSISARRSPKPGAFTAQTVETPAQPVDDEGRERLALHVLGDDQYRPPGLDDTFSRSGRMSLRLRSSCRGSGVRASSKHALHRLRVGHEVRGEIAAVEAHPLDDLEGRVDSPSPPRP